MNLPNYFLADQPAEATITPSIITEACRELRRNRERHLLHRTTSQIIHVLAEAAHGWLRHDHPFRRHALESGPVVTGFPQATLAHGLDEFFRLLTIENLHALVVQELGHAQRPDVPCSTDAERFARQSSIATGPALLAHITAGNIPVPALMSLVQGLLVRSAQFMKCASGTSLLPRLFAHSIYELEPKLGACIEIAEWPGGSEPLEAALFAETECVTATGSDEALAAIQQRLPQGVRFIGHGHRLSFGFITRDVLAGFTAKQAASDAADDVAAWNQMGCLSPHVFYVQSGGAVTPEAFAEMLSTALHEKEAAFPRGALNVEESAAIASRREIYQMRAAAQTVDTRLWHSEDSTAWTVVYESDARFQSSCLNRFIYVKSVASLTEALQHAEPVRGRVSTVGLAAQAHQATDLVTELARWGVTRVCPLGRMQRPLLTWRHDGRPTLGDLVTWTNWEMG